MDAYHRGCQEQYDPQADERQGSNLIISASNSFEHIRSTRVGRRIRARGFSAVKLVPDTLDVAVALRTEEVDGQLATFVCVLHTNGTVLMPDTYISDRKYEGIEISGPTQL